MKIESKKEIDNCMKIDFKVRCYKSYQCKNMENLKKKIN
jgi:hypothetical protein